MRVERTHRRWGPVRRTRRADDLELHLPLRRIEDLFGAPDLGPFDEGFERYSERSGIEQVVGAVELERPRRRVRLTVELEQGTGEPGVEDRAAAAIHRWCARRRAGLDAELVQTRRHGLRVLAWGFLAVVVLNGLASQFDTGDDVMEAISSGLQVAAWVALWVPVNLLVYDRWYLRRGRDACAKMLGMEVRVVPPPPAVGAGRAGP